MRITANDMKLVGRSSDFQAQDRSVSTKRPKVREGVKLYDVCGEQLSVDQILDRTYSNMNRAALMKRLDSGESAVSIFPQLLS